MANLGNNPSYVWRGIVASLEWLKGGARRRIGDGENTLVWRDPWLPNQSNGYIRTPVYEHLQNIKVQNLMTMKGTEWDLEVIADLFEEAVCEQIQSIPLSRHVQHDSWYWLLEDKGIFTVKSCYRFIQGECDDEYKSLWKRIWALKLPRKVTHVIWRLCKDCLPTNAALYNRYVDVNPTRKRLRRFLIVCFNRVLKTSVYRYPCYAGVYGTVNGSIFGVLNTATCLLREWTEAQAREEKLLIRGKTGDRVWSKPSPGWFKINIDAAVFIMGGIGVAAVVRDDQGGFVAARVLKLPGKWSPREAEALALKEALSSVLDRGYMQCEFETDCYALAATCNGSPGHSLFNTIVIDCIGLSKHINQVLFSFAFRSANNVAHVLAQAAYSMMDIGEWGLSLLLTFLFALWS
ncbi:uncharacterized protein LOC141674258 [Apium graveolens]|uniref:uncharacterized protein LOC141674258 n=1 Tax=Apium graveolens TaxID=4045 RepID=UPI003D7A5CFD